MTAKLVAIAARGPLLLVAILIVLVFAWVAGVLSRNLGLLRLRTDNPYMDGLIRRSVRIVVILIGLLLALNLLGLSSLRSEEHTSELQSLMRISYAVFCLKKKKNIHRPTINYKMIQLRHTQ